MRIKYHWNFNAASPIKYIEDIEIPILFIHGDEDDYVPTSMVYDLYNSKTKGIKDIYIAKGAKHADALLSNPSKYNDVICKFLNKINLS